jgi:predicted nucleotidyltransferase
LTFASKLALSKHEAVITTSNYNLCATPLRRRANLTQRQKKGWETAQVAARLLKAQFKVERVALFGSLLTVAKMHEASDIDLAVWGLADAAYLSAVTQLLALDPDFSIDLVQVEAAAPALRQSIFTSGIELNDTDLPTFPHLASQPMTTYAPLIGLIQQNLDELAQLTESAQRLLIKFQQTQDEDYLGTLALDLHGFYSGAERIFREIAQTVDGSVPDQSDWHRRLLRQMAAEIPGIRQPVISQHTRNLMDDYCAFRHVVRNIYTFNLRADRIQPLASVLPDALNSLKRDCEDFCHHLREGK